jgi:hypothetical protein
MIRFSMTELCGQYFGDSSPRRFVVLGAASRQVEYCFHAHFHGGTLREHGCTLVQCLLQQLVSIASHQWFEVHIQRLVLPLPQLIGACLLVNLQIYLVATKKQQKEPCMSPRWNILDLVLVALSLMSFALNSLGVMVVRLIRILRVTPPTAFSLSSACAAKPHPVRTPD